MTNALKRILNIAGGALGLAGVIFVIFRLFNYASEINFFRFDGWHWFMIFVLIIVYGAANTLLARGWWKLLCFLRASAGWGWTWRIYGLSQIAKYVPGNIFHLAGRQAMGMAEGLPGWILAKSTLWELGLVSLAGVIFVFLSGKFLMPVLPFFVPLLAFAGAFFLVEVVIGRWLGSNVASAFAWQVAFLMISGLVFISVLVMIMPQAMDPILLPGLCGAYVIAWFAGFVTPGAPAGVGIRELALLFLLKGYVAESDLLLAVVIGRMVTVVGDLSYFCAASLMDFRNSFS
jgi:uncharacterized membrane protein YbhN (UPF0104 family)